VRGRLGFLACGPPRARHARAGGCGAAQELSMEAAVALVSCLVWRERGDGGAAVRPELQGPLTALRAAARRVGKVRAQSDS